MSVSVYSEVLHLELTSITAFVFNLVLCIMLLALDPEARSKNSRFTTVAFVILVGNLISCICYFIRTTELHALPDRFMLLIRLVPWICNLYLTYYFERYIEAFLSVVETGAIRKTRYVNQILVMTLTAFAFGYFLYRASIFDGTNVTYAPGWVRVILGFVPELYFLFLSAFYFVRYRESLNRRALLTGMGAYIVTIGGILLELFNSGGILFNYAGAVLGLFMFYFGVETSDYRKLMTTIEELKEAREAAERANRSKSDFLANMSHEIRTPINAVLGMNEMILRETDDDRIRQYAANVDSSGKNLLTIINDILDFSKIEAGKLEIVEADYKLSSVLNDVATMIGIRAQKKGLDFEIYVDETLPDVLHGDEVRIRQTLVNLLTNSVKYTESGEISLTVEGSVEGDICNFRFAVTDTGIGIREEDVDKLFEQFTRVDMLQNRSIEGTGLGLAITHDLVALMNGDISVESVYGQGSTFTVTLPQKIVSDEPVGDFKKRFEESAVKGTRYRQKFTAPDAQILVVDDTQINLMVFRELLKNTLISIDTAKSAKEAIVMTLDKKYDIIFMDQRMPHMDGTQALNVIRSQHGGANLDTTVICLTADAVSGARERYIAEGFDDYLTKPIESANLERTIIRYLPEEKVVAEHE